MKISSDLQVMHSYLPLLLIILDLKVWEISHILARRGIVFLRSHIQPETSFRRQGLQIVSRLLLRTANHLLAAAKLTQLLANCFVFQWLFKGWQVQKRMSQSKLVNVDASLKCIMSQLACALA